MVELDSRCRFVFSKIFLLGLCCFVYDNGSFSFSLLCLGTSPYSLRFWDLIVLYCIVLHRTRLLDHLDWIIVFPLTTTTYSQGIITTTTYYSNLRYLIRSKLTTYLPDLTLPYLTLPRHFLVSSTNATSYASEIDVVIFLFVSQNMFLVSCCQRDRYRYRA